MSPCELGGIQPLRACTIRGSESRKFTPNGSPSRWTSGICSCGGNPVEQPLQPFFLWPHESVRRICLKNPTAPVSLREQEVGAFRAQNPFEVPDGGVNVLRCVRADPCARFCSVHVCPLRYKACFASTVHPGPKPFRCSLRNWTGVPDYVIV